MPETTDENKSREENNTPDSVERERPKCLRCGFTVVSKAWGCKNPCPNCGMVYPLGDCSD